MKDLKTWSVLLFIFISGVIVGSVFSSIILKERVKGFLRDGPRRAHTRIIMEVTRDLDLSDGQRKQIDSLIEEKMTAIDSVGREIRKTMDYYNESLLSEVREVLTDDQKALFDEKVKEIMARLERMRKERRDHHGHFDRPDGPKDWDNPPPPPDGH